MASGEWRVASGERRRQREGSEGAGWVDTRRGGGAEGAFGERRLVEAEGHGGYGRVGLRAGKDFEGEKKRGGGARRSGGEERNTRHIREVPLRVHPSLKSQPLDVKSKHI